MKHHVLKVALTGGIASGKTYCLERFAALGVPTIDADDLAREVVEPGTAGFDAVMARFGPSVLGSDGALDRAALGRVVFADAAARQDLEAIIHPLVYEAISRWYERFRADGVRFAVADIPLVYETRREKHFDRVVVTACRPEQQLERLMARSGLAEAEARQRLAAQLPIGEKARRADYTIDTSGSTDKTDREVYAVWKALNREAEAGRRVRNRVS
jgi:dephospho-CoA kinase